QVLPNFLSYILLRFESDIRSASVIGMVGGGGIGFYLWDTIRAFNDREAATVILLIVLMVMAVDVVSSRIRRPAIRDEKRGYHARASYTDPGGRRRRGPRGDGARRRSELAEGADLRAPVHRERRRGRSPLGADHHAARERSRRQGQVHDGHGLSRHHRGAQVRQAPARPPRPQTLRQGV